MSKPLHNKLNIASLHSMPGDRVEEATDALVYLAVRKRLGIPRFRFLFRLIVPLRTEVERR